MHTTGISSALADLLDMSL